MTLAALKFFRRHRLTGLGRTKQLPARLVPEGQIRSRRAPLNMLAGALCGLLVSGFPTPDLAAAPDKKPYDDQLARLAEILGAVHYLRELCSANDGQMWREHMRVLLDAESGSAVRKARLTRAFNQGYRNYSRTYTTCTPSAQTAIDRFLSEGVEITEGLAERAP